jgi:hypothetical protein
MARYRKKPVVIDAVQIRKDTTEVMEFVGEHGEIINAVDGTVSVVIHTLEGDMHAKEGDYIIRGVQGEYYPCRQDIFEDTYEEVTIHNEFTEMTEEECNSYLDDMDEDELYHNLSRENDDSTAFITSIFVVLGLAAVITALVKM